MDPATFILKANKEEAAKAFVAVHVDDTITVGEKEVVKEVQEKMSKGLVYGSNDELPCRYLGINMTREDKSIILDQDHYVHGIELPDISGVQSLKKDNILPDKYQTVFRSVASKLNMLALTSRPDFAFDAKTLTTKYGSATKSHLYQAIRLLKRAKEETTRIVIPDMGREEDWILVGVADASHKSKNELFSIAGHVIMLINKETNAATILHWSSRKIERVVSSSLAAETLSLQQLSSNMYFVMSLLKELCGESVKELKGLALTDNQDLFSCIHNIKSCDDKRLLSDIISIRQAIHNDKTIAEVRYVPSTDMIADCLTKATKNNRDLMTILRTGYYQVPGGAMLRDSTQLSIKTWQELITAEREVEQGMQDEDTIQKEKDAVGPVLHS